MFTDHIIDDPSVYDRLFAACSAMTLITLLQTSSRVNKSVKDYMSCAFDINRLLSRYFSDPAAFRYIQACSASVIAGSTALQFFDRSFYPHSDLDLYVPRVWRSRIGHFLLQDGYQFVPTSWQHPTFDVAVTDKKVTTASRRYGNLKGIAGVFTFKKHGPRGDELKVQIMVVIRSTMDVILRYHSSMFNHDVKRPY